MEVAPRYWQTPETLKEIYVSTSGGNAAGTAARRMPSPAPPPPPKPVRPPLPPRSSAARFVAQRRLQRAGQHRQGQRIVGCRGQHQPGDHGAAGRLQPRTPPAARRSPSTTRARSSPATISFNLPPGKSLSDATARHRPGHAPDRHAGIDPRQLRGHRADLPAIAGQRADADRGGAGRRLHRAGRAVRELHPPDHHPVDPALGRRRRGAGAAAVQHRVQHHRADRRDPADRHRQEERHPDDRLRARCRAQQDACRRARRSSRPACCASARS